MKRLMRAPTFFAVWNDPPVPPVNPPPAPPPPTPGTDDDDKPTLSQKKVNALMAEQKKKHEAEVQKALSQLEQVRNSKNLTDKEKEALTGRIEELQNSLLTKEQLAAKERERLETDYKGKLTDSEKVASRNWKLYENERIETAIMTAAVKHDAFRPGQISTLIRGQTSLVEDKDAEGNGLGTFTPRIKFPDVKDGKPITLDLTVEEAVKRMKDTPQEYGNLFKAGVVGGIGGSGSSGTSHEDGEKPPTTPEAYRRWREVRRKAGKI